MPALAILGGFVALVWGADRFVIGAAATARNFGVSPLVIGLTIVGFGTSAPEMLVAAMAAVMGNPGLGIGNALGSNITNVAFVLGVTALVAPLVVHSKLIRREIPILICTMAVAYVLMWHDNTLDFMDGLLLIIGMFAMIGWIVREGMAEGSESDALSEEFDQEVPSDMPTIKAVGWFTLGLVVLLGSSRLLVWGATEVARDFGVSELIIGLTVVAFGTSLPELAASVMAALKDEHDIAVGNIIGSNMFNLLGVLALPGIIAPGRFDSAVVTRDFPIMFGVTVLLLVLVRGFGEKGRLGRPAGVVLVTCYFAYMGLLYTQL